MGNRLGKRINGPHQSTWMDQALSATDTPCPALEGQRRADVAIIGGGYVGLWTAIELKRLEAGIDVVILEQNVCGSGASGRNAGYALSWWTKAFALKSKWGGDVAGDLIAKSETAISELTKFCEDEGIDAEIGWGGWVWGAQSRVHQGAWDQAVRTCRELNVGDQRELTTEEAAQLSGTNTFTRAILDRTAVMLNPGKLVRGMREAALRLGVTIHEHTPVQHFSRNRPSQIRTPKGSVTAENVVLATNAWCAAVPELSRSILVVSSDIVASAPIPDRLAQLGWLNKAGVNDSQQMVNYVRTTAEGRVLAGKGGLASAFGGRLGVSMFHSPRRAGIVKRHLAGLYPAFSDLDIESSWSGPVDRSADGLPVLGSLPNHEHILYGVGWSGNGVGPSRIGGRVLASLVLNLKNEWSLLPIVVDSPPREFPPEPFRYWGGSVVRAAINRKDRTESRGREAGPMVNLLTALAPKGVEDR